MADPKDEGETPGPPRPAGPPRDEGGREAKLAAALRANLRRRKAAGSVSGKPRA